MLKLIGTILLEQEQPYLISAELRSEKNAFSLMFTSHFDFGSCG